MKFSSNLGIRNNQVSIVRWNATSKPALGGITFFILFLLSAIYFFLTDTSSESSKNMMGILLSCTLGFVMGLSDDAYNTKPKLKFFAQLLCGVILIYFDVYIKIFEVDALNYLLTLFWVIGLMNSINMLDNMDAITTSVSSIILGGAILTAIVFGVTSPFLIISMSAVLISLLVFLYFNWYPSKMFMGDTGSQFLGIFLAIVGIELFWNAPGAININPWLGFVAIGLVFLVPITDTTTVTINRLRKRQSPFVGGKDHTTHHLSYMGLSDRKVALTLISVGLVSMASALGIFAFESTTLKVIICIFNLAIAVLMYLSTLVEQKEKKVVKNNKEIPLKRRENIPLEKKKKILVNE